MSSMDSNSRPMIIIADDDEDILALVVFRLKRAGYDALTATNGEEALGLILDRQPDLAVLDVRMPKLNGFEVLTAIRQNEATSQMPVILLSASVHESSVARGFEAGANDYLKKPFSPQELLTRVQALMERA